MSMHGNPPPVQLKSVDHGAFYFLYAAVDSGQYKMEKVGWVKSYPELSLLG